MWMEGSGPCEDDVSQAIMLDWWKREGAEQLLRNGEEVAASEKQNGHQQNPVPSPSQPRLGRPLLAALDLTSGGQCFC